MCVCVCVKKTQRWGWDPLTSVGGSHPPGGGLMFPMFMFYEHVVFTLCMLINACIYIYVLSYECY